MPELISKSFGFALPFSSKTADLKLSKVPFHAPPISKKIDPIMLWNNIGTGPAINALNNGKRNSALPRKYLVPSNSLTAHPRKGIINCIKAKSSGSSNGKYPPLNLWLIQFSVPPKKKFRGFGPKLGNIGGSLQLLS